jgi:hypothetical protein
MSCLSILLIVVLGTNICEFEDCRLGPGGYIAIADYVLWLISAFLFFKMAQLSREADEIEEDERRAEMTGRRSSKRTNRRSNENSMTERDMEEGAVVVRDPIVVKVPQTPQKKKKKKNVDPVVVNVAQKPTKKKTPSKKNGKTRAATAKRQK